MTVGQRDGRPRRVACERRADDACGAPCSWHDHDGLHVSLCGMRRMGLQRPGAAARHACGTGLLSGTRANLLAHTNVWLIVWLGGKVDA